MSPPTGQTATPEPPDPASRPPRMPLANRPPRGNTNTTNPRPQGSITMTESRPSSTTTRTQSGPATTTLRLRGAHDPGQRRPAIQWAEDVVDNEGLGRKRSKVCCIYHRPRAIGESSSEDDSSSSSKDDNSGGEGDDLSKDPQRREGGGPGRKKKRCGHGHVRHRHHGEDGGDGNDEPESARRPSPNAYERISKGGSGVRKKDGQ